MTLRRLRKLISAFFTRSLTVDDLRMLVRRLRHGKEKPPPDFAETRLVERPDPLEHWIPSDHAVDVQEAPLDTLPAELQDELMGKSSSTKPKSHGAKRD